MARGQQSKMRQKTAAADGSIADLTPKQIREQVAMMRKMTPSALRRKNPQMKDMSDAEIRQAIEHMESMANDPELRQQTQRTFAKSGPELRELQNLSRKDPNTLNAQEMHRLITLQRNMMRDNPDSFFQMMANNPQTASMSREQVAKMINQMADMDPDELQQYMSMQKSIGPLLQFTQRLDTISGGKARYVMLTIVVMFIYWVIRKVIFRV